MEPSVALLFLAFAYNLSGINGALANIEHEKRLLKDVFDKVDTRVRPVENRTAPVEITLEFVPVYVKGIDEVHQQFMAFGWVTLEWFDPQLQWKPDDYGGATSMTVPTNSLWCPDIGIINSAKHLYKDIFEPDRYQTVVRSDGVARVAYSADVHTICILDITYFPFDHQLCHVEFDFWTMDMRTGFFSNASKLITDNLRMNGLWEIEDSWMIFTEDVYRTSTYRTVSFTFMLKRKASFVLFNVVLPCFLLFILEVLVYFVPVESGEKIALGVTLMLSITVFQLVIVDHLPASSYFFPLMGLYLVGVMALSALTLIFTVTVIHLHHKDPKCFPLPKWIKWYVLHKLAKIIRIKTTQKTANANVAALDSKETEEMVKLDEEPDTCDSDSDDWILVARVIDRFFLIIYLIVSIILTCGTFFPCIGADVHREMPLGGYGYSAEGHMEEAGHSH